jgi:alpha-tubulin suppressor-like RCC1 family protein
MSIAALLAVVVGTAATATAQPSSPPTSSIQPGDGSQLLMLGEGRPGPKTPDDVWLALRDRTISSLGTSGSSVWGQHLCAIDDAGEAVCFGQDLDGETGHGLGKYGPYPAPVDTSGALDGVTLASVTTGGDHSCALGTDGQAYCWGANRYGQRGDEDWRALATPSLVSTPEVPAGRTLEVITAGSEHTCALDSDGAAYCWGRAERGRLGTGGTGDLHTPTPVDASDALAGRTLTDLDAGNYHTCAVGSDGTAFCWGRGIQGRLGNGEESGRQPSPVVVSNTGPGNPLQLTDVTAGGDHTCGLTTTGRAFCWGANSDGQLGTGDKDPRLVPTRVRGLADVTVADISAGSHHTCARTTTGQIYCWGYGLAGALGNGDRDRRRIATPIDTSALDGDVTWTDVTTTWDATCALRDTGDVYCFGDMQGTAHPGVTAWSTKRPRPVWRGPLSTEGHTIVQASSGPTHACVLDGAGRAFCWGVGRNGQLGDGDGRNVEQPVPVDRRGALRDVELVDIATGQAHTCALGSGGRAFCWGKNTMGQLGNSTLDTRMQPTRVARGDLPLSRRFVDIDAGNAHSCAIDDAGRAYCWGSNSNGQRGVGAEPRSTKPRLVDTSGVLAQRRLASIDVGDNHTCGITRAGVAVCWGYNRSGSLGDTTLTNRFRPVLVASSGVRFTQLSAAGDTTCAVSTAETVHCWGSGQWSQMGDGTTADENPELHTVDMTGDLAGVIPSQVAVSKSSVTLIGTNDYLYGWGSNAWGKLLADAPPTLSNGEVDHPRLMLEGTDYEDAVVQAVAMRRTVTWVFTTAL